MDRLTQLELFVAAVELGSLSRAAEKLGLSNASASRHLTALEERLGTRLIERTTRRQWLTEPGHDFLQRCRALLGDIAEAEAAASESSQQPRGLLRVTSSASFAMIHLAPLLPAFNRRYPELQVEIVAANRYPDFIEAGIDVAIRTREHEADSGITVRPLAQTHRVLAASPGYLAARGKPQGPPDLAAHALLIYTLAREPFVLHFERAGEAVSATVRATLQSNEGQVLLAAARAGTGILIQPTYIVHDEVVAGRLIPVLSDWALPALTIKLAYQTRKHQPAKIGVFVQFLADHFEREAMERRWRRMPSG